MNVCIDVVPLAECLDPPVTKTPRVSALVTVIVIEHYNYNLRLYSNHLGKVLSTATWYQLWDQFWLKGYTAMHALFLIILTNSHFLFFSCEQSGKWRYCCWHFQGILHPISLQTHSRQHLSISYLVDQEDAQWNPKTKTGQRETEADIQQLTNRKNIEKKVCHVLGPFTETKAKQTCSSSYVYRIYSTGTSMLDK